MTLKELEEKRNELIARGEKIVSDAEMQTRGLTEEEDKEFQDINSQVENIKSEIEKEKNKIDKGVKNTMENKELEVRAMQENAFVQFLKGETPELRSDVDFTYSDNSAVVPTGVVNKIIDKLFSISPLVEMCTTYRGVKGDLVVPYYTANSTSPYDITAAYATEFSAPYATAGKIAGVTLSDFVIMAFALISKRIINGAIPNVLDFIIEKTAYAVKKFVEGQIINGTVSKITGLSGATNTKTTASTSAITSDELVDTQDLVHDDYQENAIWVMAPSTRNAIRKLKDGQGNYLIEKDFTARWGYRMLGKEVYVSENCEAIAATKRVVFYGDFAQAVNGKVSEEMNMQVLREAYALQHAVGVLAEVACDYKVVNQQACSVLVMKAS